MRKNFVKILVGKKSYHNLKDSDKVSISKILKFGNTIKKALPIDQLRKKVYEPGGLNEFKYELFGTKNVKVKRSPNYLTLLFCLFTDPHTYNKNSNIKNWFDIEEGKYDQKVPVYKRNTINDHYIMNRFNAEKNFLKDIQSKDIIDFDDKYYMDDLLEKINMLDNSEYISRIKNINSRYLDDPSGAVINNPSSSLFIF